MTLNKGRPLSDVQLGLSASGAGFCSALVYTPADLLSIQQNILRESGKPSSLTDAARMLHSQYGSRVFWRGGMLCAGRESIYCGCGLALTPIISKYVNQAVGTTDQPTLAASFLSAMIAGTASAFFSNPFDASKSYVSKVDLAGRKYPSSWIAMSQLYKKEGTYFSYELIFNSLVLILFCFVGFAGAFLPGFKWRVVRNAGAFFIVNECLKRYRSIKDRQDK